jgi:hypothetical protein
MGFTNHRLRLSPFEYVPDHGGRVAAGIDVGEHDTREWGEAER